MTAEKIIKINSEHEADMLRERVNTLESVITYSVAETVQGLKNKVKDLENEAIALRAADSEKDKMIAEKNNQIAEIKKNFNTQLNNKLEWQSRQFNIELDKKLKHKENNMNYNHVRPLEKQVEQANNERDRIQTMYKSLLNEFNQSHNNETAILSMCNKLSNTTEEILSIVKQLLLNGATVDEVVEQIDKGLNSIQSLTIEEECIQIHNLLDNGHKKKEIAELLYPGLARGKSKVSERIRSKKYLEIFGNAIQLIDMDRQ